MAEYLSQFRPDIRERISLEEMIADGKVYEPAKIGEVLKQAREFLMNEAGPNLARRQISTPKWLNWWIDYLSGIPKDSPNKRKIFPLEELHEQILKTTTSGVLFAAAAEGHPGHRFAVNWMRTWVDSVILLLEQDPYLALKEREFPFLPLDIRLSMWNWHQGVDFLSVLPAVDPEISASDHYARIFTAVGADYCFATRGDPHLEEKMGRGKRAWFTTIPYLPILSTTQRVERLMPDPNPD